MATLSATLAQIAVTSLTAAKPATVPVVWISQPGPRRFHAACLVNGEWTKVTAGGRPAAVKALRGELARRGTPLPAEVTVKEVAPEAEVPAPKPAAPVLVVPPAVTAPVPPAAKPATVPAPVPLVGGRVTPLTNRESWAAAAEAAIAVASSLDLPTDPKEAVESFRRIVNETMRGAGFVGAYDRLPNGELWIRLCRNVYDPTSRAPRPGDGSRRVSRDINNMPVDATGASLQRQKPSRPDGYVWPGTSEQGRPAWARARAFSAVCAAAGLPKPATSLAYKLGFVQAAVAAGIPRHEGFERDIEAGQPEHIQAVTAAIVAARAAGKL
jgi:hypothetical protein